MLRQSRLQNLSSRKCQRKIPAIFFIYNSTHWIWKWRLRDNIITCWLFQLEVLIGTLFMTRHVNYICYIARQIKFSKGKISILGSVPSKRNKKKVKFIKDKYSGPTTDITTKKMDFYHDTMRQKADFSEHDTLHPYSQVQFGKETQNFDINSKEHRNSLLIRRSVRLSHGNHEAVTNKPFKSV